MEPIPALVLMIVVGIGVGYLSGFIWRRETSNVTTDSADSSVDNAEGQDKLKTDEDSLQYKYEEIEKTLKILQQVVTTYDERFDKTENMLVGIRKQSMQSESKLFDVEAHFAEAFKELEIMKKNLQLAEKYTENRSDKLMETVLNKTETLSRETRGAISEVQSKVRSIMDEKDEVIKNLTEWILNISKEQPAPKEEVEKKLTDLQEEVKTALSEVVVEVDVQKMQMEEQVLNLKTTIKKLQHEVDNLYQQTISGDIVRKCFAVMMVIQMVLFVYVFLNRNSTPTQPRADQVPDHRR